MIKLLIEIEKIIKKDEIIWIRKYIKIIFLLFMNRFNKKINKKLVISKKNQIIIKSLINKGIKEKINKNIKIK